MSSIKVDSVTKRHLIILVYDTHPKLSDDKRHSIIKKFQEILETKYNCTLGYSFKYVAPLGFSKYDAVLQEDLERYEAFGKIIDGPKLTEGGNFLFETVVPYNLEQQFGKIALEKLRNDIRKLN